MFCNLCNLLTGSTRYPEENAAMGEDVVYIYKGCNRKVHGDTQGFFFYILSGPKKEAWEKSSDQPETVE